MDHFKRKYSRGSGYRQSPHSGQGGSRRPNDSHSTGCRSGNNSFNRAHEMNRSSSDSECHRIHMRGLPYKAVQRDIVEFFKPISPTYIQFMFDNSGRPSGEANVEFACHEDAVNSMSKDKSYMGVRYIELFLNSTPDRSMSEDQPSTSSQPF